MPQMTHDCLNWLNWAISGHKPDKGATKGPSRRKPDNRATKKRAKNGS
jgi:hypothetical protein